MRFVPGQQLGPYTIHSFLGKGAMGEVYRAQDTRVQRAVAIKVLHPHMAERQAIRKRFEREARVLSALSHPNICAFQELATANGSDYLVMELLDGETLARLLGRGPLPLPQALHFAHQLASALDASHRIGLTHRDLKPGNLIVTRTGIKVLDFGLAKEDGPLPSTGGPSADEDSTVVEPLTESGAILGTFQYMAPEQLEGKAVDVRADIFSFGCILHEMLTGQRAFSGQSKAGLIASVLTQTPAPPSSVRADLPPALDRLVEGCLAKDPGDRWQSMRDVQRILDWAATPQQPSTAPATAAKRWLAPAVLVTALIAIGLLGWTLFVQRGQAPNPTVRLEIPPPPGLQYFPFPQVGPPIISPNGKLIVLPMTDGNRVFFTLRALNSSEMKVLDGTEGGTFPFWSPDSRHIAFFQKGRLVRMPIAGGPTSVIVENALGNAGSWGRNGTILFGVWGADLFSVPAEGGPIKAVIRASQVDRPSAPHFLPDGNKFLYTVFSEDQVNTGIYLSSLDAPGKRTKLLPVFSTPAYAEPNGRGMILYTVGEKLMRSSFDASSGRLTSEPVAVETQVSHYLFNGKSDFSASFGGVLLLRTGKSFVPRELAWYTRDGHRQQTIGPGPALFRYPSLSPDGKLVAVEIIDPDMPRGDLWLIGSDDHMRRRFTFDPRAENSPIFTPDGKRIVYSVSGDLFLKSVDGGGTPELLFASPHPKAPCGFTADGKMLLVKSNHPTNGGDLWMVPMQGDHRPIPFSTDKFNDGGCSLSPDGRWVAVTRDESGRLEIWIFSATPEGQQRQKVQVTTRGGTSVHWRSDSRELFFFGSQYLLAAKVAPGPNLSVSPIERLFPAGDIFHSGFGFTPSADGSRLLISTAVGNQRPVVQPVTVVLNHPALFE